MKTICEHTNTLDMSSDLRTSNFFIESTYLDAYERENPCYFLTRKSCDMVANKMTGGKGILFTATYVTKFEEMEQQIKANVPQISRYMFEWKQSKGEY